MATIATIKRGLRDAAIVGDLMLAARIIHVALKLAIANWQWRESAWLLLIALPTTLAYATFSRVGRWLGVEPFEQVRSMKRKLNDKAAEVAQLRDDFSRLQHECAALNDGLRLHQTELLRLLSTIELAHARCADAAEKLEGERGHDDDTWKTRGDG